MESGFLFKGHRVRHMEVEGRQCWETGKQEGQGEKLNYSQRAFVCLFVKAQKKVQNLYSKQKLKTASQPFGYNKNARPQMKSLLKSSLWALGPLAFCDLPGNKVFLTFFFFFGLGLSVAGRCFSTLLCLCIFKFESFYDLICTFVL